MEVRQRIMSAACAAIMKTQALMFALGTAGRTMARPLSTAAIWPGRLELL